MPFALLLAPLFLLQVDPITGAQTGPSALPIEIIEKKQQQALHRAQREAQEAQEAQDNASSQGPVATGCIDAVEADPKRAVNVAGAALKDALGPGEKVRAGMCLGIAYTQLDQWDDAQKAFTQARDAALDIDHASRARLGAMAGNAALAAGQPAQALALLGPADKDARLAADPGLVSSIALDRARALVGVNQPVEAQAVLATVRQNDPKNAQAWLLSATLSRRQGHLADAQAQIEQAAGLVAAGSPDSAQIGLEAGVIAMLAHHEDAARKSWQSVVQTAPDSPSAATARNYLAQLDQLASPAAGAAAAVPVKTKPKPKAQ